MTARDKGPRSALHWVDDPKVEADLRNMNIKWVRLDVPLAFVDTPLSLKNNARIGEALIEETRKQYAFAMTAALTEGVEANFPAPVFRELEGVRSSLKYSTLSGNHRVVAARDAGLRSIENVYVLQDVTDLQAELVARTFNRGIGSEQSDDEAAQHAVHFMNQHGLSLKETAKHFRLSETKLRTTVRLLDTRKVLLSIGFETTGWPNRLVDTIGQLRQSHPMMRAVALFYRSHRDSAATMRLVADMKAATSESEALRVAAERGSELKTQSVSRVQGGRGGNKRSAFLRMFHGIATLLRRGGARSRPLTTWNQLQINDREERAELQREWKQLKQEIDHIFRGGS
jgi:Mor family transcriptional regulator